MHFANADADHPLNEQQKTNFSKVKQSCALILHHAVILLRSINILNYISICSSRNHVSMVQRHFADQNVHELDLKTCDDI